MTSEKTKRPEREYSERCPDREEMIDAVTDAVLETLCVPRKLIGFGYLFLAARYILSRPSYEHPSMLHEIYPYVAQNVGTSRVMVERAMRYAIAKAWKLAPPDVLVNYLGLRGADLKNPPTNVEYVYLVAERVRLIVGDPEGDQRSLRVLEEFGRLCAERERHFAPGTR